MVFKSIMSIDMIRGKVFQSFSDNSFVLTDQETGEDVPDCLGDDDPEIEIDIAGEPVYDSCPEVQEDGEIIHYLGLYLISPFRFFFIILDSAQTRVYKGAEQKARHLIYKRLAFVSLSVCLSVCVCSNHVEPVGPFVPRLGMGLDGHIGGNKGQVKVTSRTCFARKKDFIN